MDFKIVLLFCLVSNILCDESSEIKIDQNDTGILNNNVKIDDVSNFDSVENDSAYGEDIYESELSNENESDEQVIYENNETEVIEEIEGQDYEIEQESENEHFGNHDEFGPPHGGPHHGGPPHGGPHHGGPPHGWPHHGGPPHGWPHHGGPPHGGPHHGGPSHGGPHHGGPHHSGPTHGGPHREGSPHGRQSQEESSSRGLSHIRGLKNSRNGRSNDMPQHEMFQPKQHGRQSSFDMSSSNGMSRPGHSMNEMSYGNNRQHGGNQMELQHQQKSFGKQNFNNNRENMESTGYYGEERCFGNQGGNRGGKGRQQSNRNIENNMGNEEHMNPMISQNGFESYNNPKSFGSNQFSSQWDQSEFDGGMNQRRNVNQMTKNQHRSY